MPFALAITAGTLVACHLLSHLSPRIIATLGLLIAIVFLVVARDCWQRRALGSDILPGLAALGLGVGMVFVPVSVTSMTGIPDSHSGVASGFLMIGHEVAVFAVLRMPGVSGQRPRRDPAQCRGRCLRTTPRGPLALAEGSLASGFRS